MSLTKYTSIKIDLRILISFLKTVAKTMTEVDMCSEMSQQGRRRSKILAGVRRHFQAGKFAHFVTWSLGKICNFIDIGA